MTSAKEKPLTAQNSLEREQLGRRLGAQGTAIGVNQANFGNQTTVAGLDLDQLKFNTAQLLGNDDKTLGAIFAKQAQNDAAAARDAEQKRADDTGLFGTTILSKNSVNGTKIPILGFG